MKKSIKAGLLACILTTVPLSLFSQLSISYYSSNLSKIGLAVDITPRFWGEIRLYSDTQIRNITPELVFCYNLSDKEFHKVYLGFGGNINYLTGFVMPVGVRFTPFEKLDRFSFHIELEPTLDLSADDIIIQSSWGIRYKFIK